MKKYHKPYWELYSIKIEETISNSSAVTQPQNPENVLTTWETGEDQEETFFWE